MCFGAVALPGFSFERESSSVERFFLGEGGGGGLRSTSQKINAKVYRYSRHFFNDATGSNKTLNIFRQKSQLPIFRCMPTTLWYYTT